MTISVPSSEGPGVMAVSRRTSAVVWEATGIPISTSAASASNGEWVGSPYISMPLVA